MLRRTLASPAFRFGLKAGVLCLALFHAMPRHPMAIPAAVGGGVAIMLISTSGLRILAKESQYHGAV